MNISKRNRKVAIARWKRVHERERKRIPAGSSALRLKAALCGFLAGDGSVQIRKEKKNYHYQMDFFPDDELMLETYLKVIERLYGKRPTIRNKNKYSEVRITSRVIVEDLTNVAKFGLYKWDLPTGLFEIKGAKEAWLRGFFSAEAYVGPKSLKVQSVNRQGMKLISVLLEDMGIKNKYYEYVPKKKTHSPVGIIFINSIAARRTYHDKVGFWHSRKTNALKQSLGL